MHNEKFIWKPITFDENWLKVSTDRFNSIVYSWYRKRETFKENEKEYYTFLERLKRQQAIETGIIEKLYDLNEGITETFIKEGFVESYIQHGDTNLPKEKLISYLKDHFDAIDFVFDFVKNNRSISKSFILELHQLITTHQDVTGAIDTNGNYVQVPLMKGAFKKYPNNPKREDGTKFMYCPPEQVESELDNLIEIYNQLDKSGASAIIKAAFFHHGFTQIHPFQDGNGRIARLMASLILVRGNLFPLTVLRSEKKSYLEGLEKADEGVYQPIVDVFCNVQIRNIGWALNWKTVADDKNYKQIVGMFTDKVKKLKSLEVEERNKAIAKNREDIFNYCVSVLRELQSGLQSEIGELAKVTLTENRPNERYYYYFTHQISEYATQHNYYFNASLPRGWIRLNLKLSESKNYNLIISLHHYGYDDGTIAIGAFLEFIISDVKKNNYVGWSKRMDSSGNEYINIPLEINPLTISVDLGITELESSIKAFLQDVLSVALARIMNEI